MEDSTKKLVLHVLDQKWIEPQELQTDLQEAVKAVYENLLEVLEAARVRQSFFFLFLFLLLIWFMISNKNIQL
jgi:hypothetical protein